MTENLKQETAKGVFWSGIERFASGGIQFLSNIVLARILSPNDFGLLAIIAIFVQISQALIDSGFSNALIQKKDRTQLDYSSVFIFNIVISILLYGIIYFFSPLIAIFFDNEKLVHLTRVICINLVIGALISVHKTRLTIHLRFKFQSIITVIASVLSAIIAIWMAYNDFGIWSLVILTLLNTSLQVLLIYMFSKWHPSLKFSLRAFKQLFSYSSKLLGASLIHLLYRNIYPIGIGKKFTAHQLGFFNRADLFASYAPDVIGGIIARVAFPIFSKIQDDNKRLRNAYSQYVIYASLLIFPLSIGMILLAEPLTILILKEKWMPMVPLLQILSIDWMVNHLSSINLNILYVKGRSDLAFKLEIIKKTVALSIFIISIHCGLIGICWGRVIYGIFAVFINSYYTKKLIGISLEKQLKDIFSPLMYSILMGLFVLSVTYIKLNSLYTIIIGIVVGIISYVLIILLFHRSYIEDFYQILKGLQNK